MFSEKSSAGRSGRPWRCRCGALLGMQHGAEMHIKYKEHLVVARGVCATSCRKCGAPSAVDTTGTVAA